MARTVLVANGVVPRPEVVRGELVRGDDRIVAVDGGAHVCQSLGIVPSVLLGDLDSIADDERARLEARGVLVRRFPVRKDQTDLDLALEWCRETGASEVLILGAWGGRWDQTLANFMLLLHHASASMRIQIADDRHVATLVNGPGELLLAARPGDTVSLLALSSPVRGVTTAGLEYPLQQGTLEPGSSLGISNAVIASPARVTLDVGALLCIHIRSNTGRK